MISATIHLKGSPAVIKIHLSDDAADDAIAKFGKPMLHGGIFKLQTDTGNKLIINAKEIACVIFDRDGGGQ